MNSFKKSEKPSHKLYSSSNSKKEFLTNKEFALDLSVDSFDPNPSFSELQNSFFSRDSSKVDKEIIEQLKEFEKPVEKKSKSVLVTEDNKNVKKNKEEETNFTTKQPCLRLEREEFKRQWLCQSCIVTESDSVKRSCSIF
jgi:hypothetical protein